MSQKTLQVFAELACRPGEEAQVEAQAVAFVEQTRSQPGCVCAVLHRVEEEPRFVFIAEFKDEESLKSHLDSGWRKAAIAGLPDRLASWPRRFTMRRVA